MNAGGRKQWVQEWQGQLVLAGSQHYWSIEMEDAMIKGGNQGLKVRVALVIRGVMPCSHKEIYVNIHACTC